MNIEQAVKEVAEIIALTGQWITLLRDEGAYKRRKLYNLTDTEWLEQVAQIMQNLMGAAADAVALGHFLRAIDAELAEKGTLSGGLATLMWDDYRKGVAQKLRDARRMPDGNTTKKEASQAGRATVEEAAI